MNMFLLDGYWEVLPFGHLVVSFHLSGMRMYVNTDGTAGRWFNHHHLPSYQLPSSTQPHGWLERQMIFPLQPRSIVVVAQPHLSTVGTLCHNLILYLNAHYSQSRINEHAHNICRLSENSSRELTGQLDERADTAMFVPISPKRDTKLRLIL